MLIENALSDAVRFFHMDALSSAVGLKVDFDMALLVIASGLYRLLARRMHGYADAQARHLPPASLDEQVRKLEKYKDRPVVVYCRSGARSARVGGVLRKHGFAEVFNLDGGLGAWQSADLPVHRGPAKN
jgi:rhodanese-related sulfurtransferase